MEGDGSYNQVRASKQIFAWIVEKSWLYLNETFANTLEQVGQICNGYIYRYVLGS